MISLVTADNFNRAETDLYFASAANEAGGVGKFFHRRDVMPVDKQTVVRANRDTLYSSAVFDLDAGPVTITLPDPGDRFMSMMVIDEDQYAAGVVYGKGRYTYTKDRLSTRYIMIAVRTLVNPTDPEDLHEACALQDAILVGQSGQAASSCRNGIRRAREGCAKRCSRSARPSPIRETCSARGTRSIPFAI